MSLKNWIKQRTVEIDHHVIRPSDLGEKDEVRGTLAHIYVDQDSQLPFGNATLAAVGTSSWKFVRMYLYHVHIFISSRARPQLVYSIPASYPIRRVFLK